MTKEHTGNWYAARLLFLSLIDGAPGVDPLFEERVVLVSATSHDEAAVTARRYGVREAHEYRNEQGQLVSWVLHSLEDVAEAPDEPMDGCWAVLSRYLRKSEIAEPLETD